MTDSIFDRIIRREIPAAIVFEDEHVNPFREIAPQAPVPVSFRPHRGRPKPNEPPPDDPAFAGRLLIAAAAYAKAQGFAESGYRVLMNCNRDGGQTVFHIHLHLLAGRALDAHFG